MNEIIDLIFNYGIGIVCVGYMIYFQNTTMMKLQETQKAMLETLMNMNHRLDLIESKIERKTE